MRKLLFKSLLQAPLTEPPPRSRRRGARRAGAERSSGASRRRLGRSAVHPRGRCRLLQRLRARDPRAQQCLLRPRALRPALRRLAAPCRRAAGHRPGHAATCARRWSAPISATPDPKWVVAVGDCALDGGVFAGSYAVRRRRLRSRARRPPHPRLPADADRAAQGPDRAGGEGGALVGLTSLQPCCEASLSVAASRFAQRSKASNLLTSPA